MPVTTYGSAEVELRVDDNTFQHKVVITDVTTFDIILGLDFLEKYGCLIDTVKKTLQFGNKGPVVMLTSSSPVRGTVIAQVELTLDKPVRLPACSEMELMVKTPGGVAGKT